MSYGIKSPARYMQGNGELANLGRNVKKMAKSFSSSAPRTTKSALAHRFGGESEVGRKGSCFLQSSTASAPRRKSPALWMLSPKTTADVVIGVGGGKVIDTAKAVVTNLGGYQLVIIPTVASNDSPCSGVAVIYNDEGVVIKALMMKRNPDLVLVDTAVIAQSPKRLLVAGMGDALATWFEARACKASGVKTMARGPVLQHRTDDVQAVL